MNITFLADVRTETELTLSSINYINTFPEV